MKKLFFTLAASIIFLNLSAQEPRFVEVVVEEKKEITPDEYTFYFTLSEKTRYIADTPSAVIEPELIEEVEETDEILLDDVEVIEEVEPAHDYSYRRKRNYTPKKRIVVSIEELEEEIRDYLKKHGINGDLLAEEVNEFNKYSSRYKRGYTLKLSSNDNIHKTINGIDSIGASSLTLIDSKANSIEKHRKELALKAMKTAKQQATDLVAVYGERLGKVISIVEVAETPNATNDKFYQLLMAELARKNKTESWSVVLNYQVKVRFAIKE